MEYINHDNNFLDVMSRDLLLLMHKFDYLTLFYTAKQIFSSHFLPLFFQYLFNISTSSFPYLETYSNSLLMNLLVMTPIADYNLPKYYLSFSLLSALNNK